MLSIIIAGALFAACLYGGAAVRAYYKSRSVYFASLHDFASVFIDEISYLKTPVPKVIAAFSPDKKTELTAHLQKYKDALEADVIVSEERIAKMLSTIHLKKSEKTKIAAFLYNLGKSDASSQVASIKHHLTAFAKQKEKTAEDFRVLGNLYYKLAILLGIALMIIVV
jgi:stage III sporulation protein AB